MKRTSLLTIGIAFAVCLLLPALASANWKDKGKELSENGSMTLSGELAISGTAGSVTCSAELGTTLTAGTSSGHVNSLAVAEPSKCDVGGAIGTICGTNSLTKIEKTGTWGLSANAESDIVISSVDLHYSFAGCLMPGLRVKGTITASPDKTTAITKVTFSGKLTAYNVLGEASGETTVSGTPSVSPSGTYGVAPIPPTQTKWTMSNAYLSKTEKATLGGTFSLTGSEGTVSCPNSSAELSLTAGEVEEETPEGSVSAFTVSEPTKCDVTGTLGTLCGTNSVSKVEKTGTWGLTTNKSDISVSDVDFHIYFKECSVVSLRIKGSLTTSVNSATSISSITNGGTLTSYNTKGEAVGSFNAGGTQSVSPATTFAIEKTSAPKGPTVWTKKGEAISSDSAVHFEGSTKVESQTLGSVTCASKATMIVDLLAGTHNATVTSFTDSAPTTDCTVAGFLGSTCGTKSLTEVKLLKHAAGTGTLGTKQLDLSEIEFLTKFGSCVSLVLTGSVLATLDSETAFTTATISGELATSGFGNTKISGDLKVTEAESGQYGLEKKE